ncbi:MAG: sialate O-acetylesterase [Ferruginibacter sp.]
MPAIFSNGMVLQRNSAIPVWGNAKPGVPVTVVLDNKKKLTVTGIKGKWIVSLPAFKAGGPYTLKVYETNNPSSAVEFTDVLVGDVWIASGQSNMEWEMRALKEKYNAEIAASENNLIRQFAVKREFSFTPQDDIHSDGWKTAGPENTLSFSAVAYFFAKELYAKYKIPIGIINTTWGGTPAEAWTSKEALKPFPNYLKRYEHISRSANVEQVKARVDSLQKQYALKLDNYFKNDTTGYSCTLSNYDASAWKMMKLPTLWETGGLLNNYDGLVWFRKEIEIPAELAGKVAVLELSYIDDIDNTYINGQPIGSSLIWNEARKYIVPAGILKAGKNIIAVKVMDTGGGGGIYGNGNLQLSVDGKVFALDNEWQYKPFEQNTLPLTGQIAVSMQNEPTALYNSMIAPLVPYAIKGVIWYQGEANANRAKEYEKLFPNMITDWRNRFKQGNFPFLFVQLANFIDYATGADWPALRDAQTKTLKTSLNTGMAVTIDIGETNDIHPKNKKDVGLRLALAAEKTAYKENIVYSGPMYQLHQTSGDKIVISFTHTGSGLLIKGDSLRQFFIAGADKKFVPANAFLKNNTVVVWSNAVRKPVAVRYAWTPSPEGCNLYNKEGLPAIPFRTDNWNISTENK